MISPRTTPPEPCADAGPSPRSPQVEHCELCGERNAIDADAFPPTGLWICTQCVEEMLDAQPYEPRAEVGLVGTCGGRS